MRKIIFLLVLSISFISESFALSVTIDNQELSCGVNTVTLIFDCPFTGLVLATNDPPTGITFVNVPQNNPPFIDVTNGQITFDVDVNLPDMAGSFTINYLVISTDLTCTVANDAALATFNYNCIFPENNECVDATVLDISYQSCTFEAFSTVNGSGPGFVPSCAGAVSAWADLWYIFTANDPTVTISLNSAPGVLAFFGLYDACPNSGGTELQCDNILNTTAPTTYDLTGLTIGNTYYLQMMYNPGLNGDDQEFCLHSNAVPPPCDSQIIVSDAGPNLPNNNYQTSDIISTSGPCNVTTGAIYDAANCVLLDSGFECQLNFEAVIGGCTP